MPKFRRESDYGRFRIIQVGKKFIVEEKRPLLGLWETWKTVESYGYPFEFISLQEAKDYIDLKIENETTPKQTGVLLYP